ncbi:unnamed protein product [Rotaria magnacalcarata]|uniref:DDE Tnp4 domain-containing protein n=1 Tax=Rotaria magnacalcarata TaxID=392030 RepID=A0A816G3E2_9BILA|nr:unnamed protein product [Rotaria magnacalcarata]CAF1669877.1 unnamed protein product [Rotaria magnacalcarata]CAF2202980.1 unnamed protein product [Rotaria magnacalcarata]CAF3953978.1 unnamed protein product [Rotaria magnacalcarata]CAF4028916.1 unnamed protein product [Rotaria magnacalcarata]
MDSSSTSLVDASSIHSPSTSSIDASLIDSSSASSVDASPIDSVDTSDDGPTLENVLYAGSNRNRCVICRRIRDSSTNMITMPKSSRLDLLIVHRTYAPQNVRCCEQHIVGHDRLNPMYIVEMNDRKKLKTTLPPQELLLILEDLLTLIQEAIKSPRLDSRDPALSNDDYLIWTGWNIAQFDIMLDMLSPFLRSSCSREPRNAIAIFWIKAKTDLSFNQIGSLFNYTGDSETRRKRVADTFDSVRILLVRNFVPLNLGVYHLTRDQALIHNTAFSKEFWDNKVTIIWDGTYIYIEKSSDHYLNRSTYSGQKCRHLVKFMSLVHPDGYVLDTIGPFQGTANDATIAQQIIETRNELIQWWDYGDIMICDRGFRDVIKTLGGLGYEVKSPAYLNKSQINTTQQKLMNLV